MKAGSEKSSVPLFKVSLGSEDALWRLYSRVLAEGEVFIEADGSPDLGNEVRVELAAAGLNAPPVIGRVLSASSEEGKAGFRVSLDLNKAFRHFFAKRGVPRKYGKRRRNRSGKRLSNRFDARLDVSFNNFPHLPVDHATNISAGGIFVKTAWPPPLGSRVLLTLRPPGGQPLETEAEVIHVITPEEAEGHPYAAGVGLSFTNEGIGFRQRLDELLAGYERMPARVLVVDDDQDFRLALAEGLESAGMRVDTAASGEEALRKLVDGLFELDVVLLDLRMPGLDGRGFLDRVRRLGGELDLPILVLSAAKGDDVQALKGPTGATDVLTKTEPLNAIVGRIHQVLGKAQQALH